jgi:transcriptional regulator with XRE-family HTH domain
MPLGETLRKARLARKLTPSEVAQATRMKVQIVEALEKNQFDLIPAPIYAKGFIRLFAEYVGLDSEPLIVEYNRLRSKPPLSGAPSKDPSHEAPRAPVPPRDEAPSADLFSHAGLSLAERDEATETEAESPVRPPTESARPTSTKSVLSREAEPYTTPSRTAEKKVRPTVPPPSSPARDPDLSRQTRVRIGERLGAVGRALRQALPERARALPLRGGLALAGAVLVILLIATALLHSRRTAEPPDTPTRSAHRIATLGQDTPEPYFD